MAPGRRVGGRGWSACAGGPLPRPGIAERPGLPLFVVSRIIRPNPRRPGWQPPPPRPPRPSDAACPSVRGQRGTRFRRLLELGYDPPASPSCSGVRRRGGPRPGRTPARRQGRRERRVPDPLARARSRREQEAVSEWSRFLELEPEPLPAIADDEPVMTAIAAAEPTPCEGWEDIRAAETHHRKLSGPALRHFWELRQDGLSRRELAHAFEVSMATVGRLLKAWTAAARRGARRTAAGDVGRGRAATPSVAGEGGNGAGPGGTIDTTFRSLVVSNPGSTHQHAMGAYGMFHPPRTRSRAHLLPQRLFRPIARRAGFATDSGELASAPRSRRRATAAMARGYQARRQAKDWHAAFELDRLLKEGLDYEARSGAGKGVE